MAYFGNIFFAKKKGVGVVEIVSKTPPVTFWHLDGPTAGNQGSNVVYDRMFCVLSLRAISYGQEKTRTKSPENLGVWFVGRT